MKDMMKNFRENSRLFYFMYRIAEANNSLKEYLDYCIILPVRREKIGSISVGFRVQTILQIASV